MQQGAILVRPQHSRVVTQGIFARSIWTFGTLGALLRFFPWNQQSWPQNAELDVDPQKMQSSPDLGCWCDMSSYVMKFCVFLSWRWTGSPAALRVCLRVCNEKQRFGKLSNATWLTCCTGPASTGDPVRQRRQWPMHQSRQEATVKREIVRSCLGLVDWFRWFSVLFRLETKHKNKNPPVDLSDF